MKMISSPYTMIDNTTNYSISFGGTYMGLMFLVLAYTVAMV